MIRCEGGQNYMKLFVANKMTQNNTLNKVHVVDQPRLNYRSCCRTMSNMFETQPHKIAVRLCAAVKLIEKNKLLEVDGRHVPQCLTAGDSNAVTSISCR